MSPDVPSDTGWATRLQFRQLPEDASDLDRRIDALNRRQLPGPGWNAILDELHERLVALDPGYSFIQIKEKLGTLRAYVEIDRAVQAAADEFVREAELRSAVTCESCGDPGMLRDDRAWKLTLCEVCDIYHPDGRPLPSDWPDPSEWELA